MTMRPSTRRAHNASTSSCSRCGSSSLEPVNSSEPFQWATSSTARDSAE